MDFCLLLEIYSFARNIGKNVGKNVDKILGSKYSQKRLIKQSATDVLKTAPKKTIQKTAVATGDLIVHKIIYRITKFQKCQQRIIQKQMKKK